MTLDEARELVESYPKWLQAFQQYCDSKKIRDESEINGINACGYGIQCDECDPEELGKRQCAKAMVKYYKNHNITIDFRNTGEEYFRKLMKGELNK